MSLTTAERTFGKGCTYYTQRHGVCTGHWATLEEYSGTGETHDDVNHNDLHNVDLHHVPIVEQGHIGEFVHLCFGDWW